MPRLAALKSNEGKFMFKVPVLSVLSGAMLMAFGPAQAVCAINTFFDRSATFGAAADAHYACSSTPNGGGGNLVASKTYDNNPNDWHTRATAALGAGTLTAWAGSSTSTASNPIYAASTLWDTFTFNGLPSGGATLVSTLFLTGSMTGTAASGDVIFTQGSNLAQQFNFTAASGVPTSVSYSFTAFNGVPIKLGVELEVLLYGAGSGVADLEDPPTFSVVVPTGTTFTSASGVFSNVGPSPVPEMPTLLLTLAGLGLVAAARAKRRGHR